MKCHKCEAPMYRVAFDPYTFNTTYECPGCGERFVTDKIEIPKAVKGVVPKKKPTVYLVMCEEPYGDGYSTFVEKIFTNEKKAEECATALNKQFSSFRHYVIDREVEE